MLSMCLLSWPCLCMHRSESLDAAAGASGMSCLHALVAIAAALNNADADGRILVDAHAQSIRFVLLNGAAHFVKVGFFACLCTACHCIAPLTLLVHVHG